MNAVSPSYGPVAILLHWLIALLIFAALGIAWTMTDDSLPNGPEKFQLYQWHKSLGMTVLTLSLLRLVWRLVNPPPPLPEGMRPWEIKLTRLVHGIFYFLMIALPLTGWMMNSASPYKLEFFGWFEVPSLPVLPDLPNKDEVRHGLGEAHESLATIMIALLILHVAGALKHHFVNRDNVLRRMMPRCPVCCGSCGTEPPPKV